MKNVQKFWLKSTIFLCPKLTSVGTYILPFMKFSHQKLIARAVLSLNDACLVIFPPKIARSMQQLGTRASIFNLSNDITEESAYLNHRSCYYLAILIIFFNYQCTFCIVTISHLSESVWLKLQLALLEVIMVNVISCLLGSEFPGPITVDHRWTNCHYFYSNTLPLPQSDHIKRLPMYLDIAIRNTIVHCNHIQQCLRI